MKKIKTGVVGYGFSGRIFQCPFVDAHDGFELTGVVERNGDGAITDYPYIKQYRSLDEMLENDSIELVIVSTPPHLHFQHAMKALIANKHVLIEKPFATTKEEANILVEKAKEMNKVVTVYQNRRFDGDFLTIKKLIDDGVSIYEFEATWDRAVLNFDDSRWQEHGHQGSDLLFDLGTHFLDQALALFGEPISVHSKVKTIRPKSKIFDYFSIELEYIDKVVRLKSCMHASKGDVRYKIHTDKGTYYFYNMDLQEEQLLSGIRPLDQNYGDTSTYDLFDVKGQKSSIKIEKGNYLMYFDALQGAIRNNEEYPVSTSEAVRVISYLDEFRENK